MKKIYLLNLLLIFTTSVIMAAVPLSGNYTINQLLPSSSTNFVSFSDFATSINLNGISGPVTVTVTAGSGPYSGKVDIINTAGTSAVNTVTIDGSGEELTVISNTTDRYALRLSNVSNFIIDNLHVRRDTTSSSGFYGIHIFGSGNNIVLRNCMVDMNGTSSTLVGGYIASGSATSILEEGDFHFITIEACSTMGGGYGASVFGLASNLATDIVVRDCNFVNFHDNGIYLRETNGTIIRDNFFDKNNSNVTSVNAIQVAQALNINARIFNNFIQVGQTANGTVTFRGIYLFNGTGHKVYNNVIHNVNLTSGDFIGIEIRTAATAPEISYNTISVDNPVASTGDIFGIGEELSNTNAVLRNNIISLSQPTSGIKAGLVIGAIAAPATALNSNYNDIYTGVGGNAAMKGTLTPAFYPTLSDWQNISGQDLNSVVIDPMFTSFTLSVPTNPLLNNLGTGLAGVTEDVLGFTRGTPPDMGAYEFLDVGMAEGNAPNEIFMFPNPSSDEIKLTNPGTGNCMVTITDASGRVVMVKHFNGKEKIISVHNFASGTYMVRVSNETGVLNGKLIRK